MCRRRGWHVHGRRLRWRGWITMYDVESISRRRMEGSVFIVAAVGEGEWSSFGSSFDERRGPIFRDGCTIIIGGDGWEDGGIGCTRGVGFDVTLIKDEHGIVGLDGD
jgi:hypothetical protein